MYSFYVESAINLYPGVEANSFPVPYTDDQQRRGRARSLRSLCDKKLRVTESAALEDVDVVPVRNCTPACTPTPAPSTRYVIRVNQVLYPIAPLKVLCPKTSY